MHLPAVFTLKEARSKNRLKRTLKYNMMIYFFIFAFSKKFVSLKPWSFHLSFFFFAFSFLLFWHARHACTQKLANFVVRMLVWGRFFLLLFIKCCVMHEESSLLLIVRCKQAERRFDTNSSSKEVAQEWKLSSPLCMDMHTQGQAFIPAMQGTYDNSSQTHTHTYTQYPTVSNTGPTIVRPF